MEDLTWAGIKALHDIVLEAAQTIAATGEDVLPQLLFFQVEPDGEVLNMLPMPQELINRFFCSGQAGKDRLAMVMYETMQEGSYLRNVFIEGKRFAPNAMVQVNEAWAAAHPTDVDIRKAIAPSKDPARKEVLMVAVHTTTRTVPVIHYIEQNPRRVVRSPFPEEGRGTYRGRFCAQSNYDFADVYKEH